MSQNYHNPIGFAAPANSAIFNAPLAELDQAITDLDTRIDTLEGYPLGTSGFIQLAFQPPTTLTIASGTVTINQSRHVIAAETGTADDLDMIAGYDTGLNDFLIISADVGDTITVKHNTGATAANRIWFADEADRILDDEHQTLWLIYDKDNQRWVENSQSGAINRNTELATTDVKLREITLPEGSILDLGNNAIRLDVRPTWMRRSEFGEKAAAATYAAKGMAAGTNTGAGAVTEANDTNSTFVSQAITNVSGTFGGRRTTTFDLVRRSHNPVFTAVIRTGADITNIRYWIGLFSAMVTNVDTIAAGTSALAFRYSTVVPDAGWVGVSNDGAAQNITSVIAAVGAGTLYRLRLRVDTTNGVVYFSVNDSAEASLNVTLPATTTELGAVVTAVTTTNSAKVMDISRYDCEFN